MAEPISTAFGGVTAASAGTSTTLTATTTAAIGLLSLFPGIDAAVAMGAFAGAAVFVMSSTELSTSKKIAFFLISFLAGYVSAGFIAEVVALPLLHRLQVPHGVGALIASAIAVKSLLWLIGKANNIDDLVNFIKGRK
ncbi:MAG: hypothetical protein IT497_01400 [Ottowia sp.]|nr:hypothetical protein [Ottowia sp.]